MLTSEEVADLRRRVMSGEHLDAVTTKAVVEWKRGARMSAAEAATKAKSSKRTKKVMTDNELDDILGIGTDAGEGAGGGDELVI